MNAGTLRWRVLIVVMLALVLLALGTGQAAASNIRGGDSLVVGQAEVIDDDLILFGNTVVVNGTVNGDLIAFANDVTLNGTVNGSAMLGGQRLTVNGTVTGTLYSSGGELRLNSTATIGRNVMFGGYSLQTAPGSAIARDLSIGGAQAVLSGLVGRDVLFGGQALELSGEVGRNVKAEVADPNQVPFWMYGPSNLPPAIPPGLRVARDAKISGQLTYVSTVDQSNQIVAQPTGGVVFRAQPTDMPTTPQTFVDYEWLWNRVRDFVTVLLLGLLGIWLVPQWVNTAVEHAQTKPLAATGWGLVMLIGGYVAAVVAVILVFIVGIVVGITTLGGLATAIFGVGLSGLTLYVTAFTGLAVWGAKVIFACLIGKIILQWSAKSYSENSILALLIGLVLFEVVAAIPVLGAVLTFVVMLLGLGAMWYVYYARRKRVTVSPRQAPMPV